MAPYAEPGNYGGKRDMIRNYDVYLTEQAEEEYKDADQMSTLELVTLINREDRHAAKAVEEVLPVIAEAAEEIAQRLENGGRLFYVGAGTSGRLGVIDAAECPPTYGTDPEMVQAVMAGGREAVFQAVENAEDGSSAAVLQEKGFGAKDVCFGISASGSAEFVQSAIRYAKSLGALTVLLCTNPASEFLKTADIDIVPCTGPEVIAGSTRMKSATAQKMVLTSLSTAVMVRLGKVQGNRMVCMRASNRKLQERAVRMVMELSEEAEEEVRAVLEKHRYDIRRALEELKH